MMMIATAPKNGVRGVANEVMSAIQPGFCPRVNVSPVHNLCVNSG
jgi:hypothetical protein